MTKKQLKNTLLGAMAMLSSIFLIAGCGGPDNPQAIALDKIDIKDIVDDLSNDKLPSDKDLAEISKKLGSLPNDPVYNEVLNLKDTLDAYTQLNKIQEERKKNGASIVPADRKIIHLSIYLINNFGAASDGSDKSKYEDYYFGRPYQYVLGTALPQEGVPTVIKVANHRQVKSGVNEFYAYQDGNIDTVDDRGFKESAFKFIEVSELDKTYTEDQAKLEALKDNLKTKAAELKQKLNDESLDKYVEAATNTPVTRTNSN